MKNIFIVLFLVILSSNVNALLWGEDKYCKTTDVKNKKCHKGDLLYTSPFSALKFCDFDKPIISFSSGDASDISARAICYYAGYERIRR